MDYGPAPCLPRGALIIDNKKTRLSTGVFKIPCQLPFRMVDNRLQVVMIRKIKPTAWFLEQRTLPGSG